jgi:hypothetical protein
MNDRGLLDRCLIFSQNLKPGFTRVHVQILCVTFIGYLISRNALHCFFKCYFIYCPRIKLNNAEGNVNFNFKFDFKF